MASADTAVILELSGQNPLSFTCVDNTSISKGALLKLSDDLTVWLSSANGDKYAGVAAADKVANDGATRISVHVPGQNNVFDMKCYAAGIAAGIMVVLSGINLIGPAVDGDYELGKVIGQIQETGSSGTVVRVIS